MRDWDELQRLGLYDPTAPDAADRRALLDFVLGEGVSTTEIDAAERNGRLASLFTEHIVGVPVYTSDEVATRAGLPADLIVRVWKAAGFPVPAADDRPFTEGDLETLAIFGVATTLFGEDAALQLVRVISSSVARIAESALASGLVHVDNAYFPTATGALEALRASAELNALLPATEQAIGYLLRRHLVAANRRLEATRTIDEADAALRDVAIGFADLTGSTALSVRLTPADFARAMGDFEAIMSDTVWSEGGRVVKLIGDEVMYAADTPTRGCAIAHALLMACAGHRVLPALRVAVNHGPMVLRDGDYYGPAVNLAARLVHVAAPGQVVAPAALADALDPSEFAIAPAGIHTLRGFTDPVVVRRIRPAPSSA